MQDAQFDYRDYVWIILTVVSPLGLLSQGHEKKQFFSLQEDFDKIIILFHQLRGPRYDHENFFFISLLLSLRHDQYKKFYFPFHL